MNFMDTLPSADCVNVIFSLVELSADLMAKTIGWHIS
jgi:hypothetical protein